MCICDEHLHISLSLYIYTLASLLTALRCIPTVLRMYVRTVRLPSWAGMMPA